MSISLLQTSQLIDVLLLNVNRSRLSARRWQKSSKRRSAAVTWSRLCASWSPTQLPRTLKSTAATSTHWLMSMCARSRSSRDQSSTWVVWWTCTARADRAPPPPPLRQAMPESSWTDQTDTNHQSWPPFRSFSSRPTFRVFFRQIK